MPYTNDKQETCKVCNGTGFYVNACGRISPIPCNQLHMLNIASPNDAPIPHE